MAKKEAGGGVPAPSRTVDSDALRAFAGIVGRAHVITDADARSFYAGDLFFAARTPPLCVVAPGTRDEIVGIVRAAAEQDLAVVPRGGGLSYTAGYVADDPRSIVLDTRRVSRILEISDDDLFATVECGCTWAALDAALAERGLRVPHFGPATGRVSTIGGGLSQNTVLFGSAAHGTAADNVLGIEMVLADGSRFHTGSGAIAGGTPFFRYHGPDLGGLFLGDCGAFGVKLSATFRLMRRPPAVGYASFSFPTMDAMLAVQAEIGRSRLAADVLGMGPHGSPEALQPANAATMHVVVEGLSQRDVDERLGLIRGIAGGWGTEVEAQVPAFLRAHPFTFVQSLLAEDGRLQAWTHGIAAFSKAQGLLTAVRAYFASEAARMARHDIDITISVGVMGTGLLIEPVMRWRDRPRRLHLEGLGDPAPSWSGAEDPTASEAVAALRRGLAAVFQREGAAHLQIGRFYNYRDGLEPGPRAFVQGLKQALDPQGLMNPGALGLGGLNRER